LSPPRSRPPAQSGYRPRPSEASWFRPLPDVRDEVVELGATPGATLRIAVISDTHGRPHPRAAELVSALTPDLVLHAGDVGDAACLAPFAAIAPELRVVRGNIDGLEWPDVRVLSLVTQGHERLRMLLTHIAVSSLKPTSEALTAAARARCDLIVCGHSHVPFVTTAQTRDPQKPRPIALFNPGSIGPRRFHLPIVFGLITLEPTGRLAMTHIDCESGTTWAPP